jgi:hypothetical protein
MERQMDSMDRMEIPIVNGFVGDCDEPGMAAWRFQEDRWI